MNANKRRSSLRKAPPKEDETTITTTMTKQQQIKRRISFSGKKSVREFVNTKETNHWDDSYEVSEHNAEDSTGSRSGSLGTGSGSKPGSQKPEDADKENVPLRGLCEREQVDLTLNFQTSVDVTMLPCELMQNQRKASSSMVSICLSTEERKVFQNSLYDHRVMDKTMDLMSGSLITRTQTQPSNIEDSSIEQPDIEREKKGNTPAAKGIMDFFMDITPVGFRAPPSAAPTSAPGPPDPVPAASALAPTPAAPQVPTQQSFMELEDDSMDREMREFNEKEKKTPVQKSLFMDLEETVVDKNNKTQHCAVDVSFDCPLNVSEDRDPLPSCSFDSNNSTIKYMKDESMLIPFDMIVGKNISKKINFRQLNDELEAGKIQLFPNGPKTPTTDRKTNQNRFWHGLQSEATESCSPKKDIRSIKPRGTLNFSENMTMSPAQLSPVRKEKEKLNAVDDKRKYRLSQADEMMLDNTNFLAHARLGDETQSRNTSKNSTRRETTYDNSELNLEYPTSSQDFHPISSSMPQKAINVTKELQQDQSDFPGIPIRRTLHLNESMDQEATKSMHVRSEVAVTTEKIFYEKSTNNERNTNQQGKVWACTKTKRRETLLMQESMEEDIISPLKDLHLKPAAAPVEKSQSKGNHTLYLAEPVEEENENRSNMLPLQVVAPKEKSKPRQTLLLEEPMEEEMEIDIRNPPVFNSKRRTLHLAEPVEEEEVNPSKTLPPKICPPQEKKSNVRVTLLLGVPMDEEMGSNIKEGQLFDSKRKSLHFAEDLEEDKINPGKNLPNNIFTHQGNKSKPRQTLLLEEPMEEDTGCTIADSQVQVKNIKSRHTLLLGVPIEEEAHAERIDHPSLKSRQVTISEAIEEEGCPSLPKNKSILRHKTIDRSTVPQRQKAMATLLMSEPIEETFAEHHPTEQRQQKSRLKSRNTLLMHEPIDDELAAGKEDNAYGQHRFKPRQTLIMSEPIEEDVGQPGLKSFNMQTNETGSSTSKSRHTLLMSEPIDEDVWEVRPLDQNKEQLIEEVSKSATTNKSSKSRPTLMMSEPIEEEVHKTINSKNYQSHSKSRQTEFMEESIQERTFENVGQPSKSRQTIFIAEPIEEDMGVEKSIVYQDSHSRKRIEFMEDSTVQAPIKNVGQPSKSRQTLLMAEPIEEDEGKQKSIAYHNDQSRKRNDVAEKPINSRGQPFKTRQTLLMAEPIEEDEDEQKSTAYCNNQTRKRIDFMEESKEQAAIKSWGQPSKSRQTLHMAEPIEEDVGEQKSIAYHNDQSRKHNDVAEKSINSRGQPSKSRQTLLMAEPIEEDEDEHKSIAYHNDQSRKRIDFVEESIERSATISRGQQSKSRQTLLMAEPIEEDEDEQKSTAYYNNQTRKRIDFMEESKEEAAIKSWGQPSKSRQTLLLAEPIEEDSEVHNKLTQHSRLKNRNTQLVEEPINVEAKSTRQTLLNAEPIEEDLELFNRMENQKQQPSFKPRFIQQFEEPIEKEISSSTNQKSGHRFTKSGDTFQLAEPVEADAERIKPINHFNGPHQQQKPRNTLLTHEPIQEDFGAGTEDISARPLKFKARHTLIMAEPIEEDPSVYNKSTNNHNSEAHFEPNNLFHSSRYTTSKTRHTLVVQEPIEEDDITYHHHEESKTKSRNIEKEVVPLPTEKSKNKSRNTMVLSELIDEDVEPKEAEISRKSRATLASAQPIEEDLPVAPAHPKNIPASSAPSFRRHTLLLSEPMEEDEETDTLSNPTTVEQVSEKLEKPKGVLRTLKDYIFKKSEQKEEREVASTYRPHQTIVMSESLDLQSPKNTMKDADFKEITPLPNTRTASRIKQLSTYTPGMSLTEFEDQEMMCKTPIHEKQRMQPQRKQFSMYQPEKMDLEADATGSGTPKSHTQMKRLSSHLTPNLPESKKQHTKIIVDSNMDMEMEEDQENAWEMPMTKIKLEPGADKSLRTFAEYQLDASVQPVRDYHPAMTELNKKSSLNILELPRKSVFVTELEDKPITISDVTNYFQEQRKSNERKSGSSNDRTFKSFAATNTKFINLTGDTTIFAGMEDLNKEEKGQHNQIDNERLSLVSTLAEETDDDVEEEDQEEPQPQPELCEGQTDAVVIAGSSGSCKKCGNCNQSLSETKLITDSFFLPHQTEWEFSRERKRLRLLRNKPTWKEVKLYWEIEEQARLSRCQDIDDSVDQTRVEEELIAWNKAALLEQCKRLNGQQKATIKPAKSFFGHLKSLLAEQQPNWIFDFQRKVSQQFIFYHRLLTTFRIVVNYKTLDLVEESAIQVCSIEVDNAVPTSKERWSASDYFLDFQLSLKLPLNLTDAIEGSDEPAFLKFLLRIDQSVVEIKRMFHELMTVLTEKKARLQRDANRTVVRKTVRKCIEDDPIVRLEKTSFLVEIINIKEVSFRDILRPELHLFNENIQYLPKGIAFLEAFLTDPEQYLKT
ncbi:uncharacterized protein LOC108054064 [Drosophila rhopaloa]|uniref:Titin n=1 Tax=Drosophila rhopaloa TaxID=1041015 RepID=A0ABM5I900_DRORH|nr:uncharacterized protein LOC108054064 [Drosophila rhopaloa]